MGIKALLCLLQLVIGDGAVTDVVISRVGNSIVGLGAIGTGRITASLQPLKQGGVMSSHISFVALI